MPLFLTEETITGVKRRFYTLSLGANIIVCWGGVLVALLKDRLVDLEPLEGEARG